MKIYRLRPKKTENKRPDGSNKNLRVLLGSCLKEEASLTVNAKGLRRDEHERSRWSMVAKAATPGPRQAAAPCVGFYTLLHAY
jgi:hypothetical protein